MTSEPAPRRARLELTLALAAALAAWLAAALAGGAASLSLARAPSVLAALLLGWGALDASRALDLERALERALTVVALPLLVPRLAAGDADVSGLALLVLAVGRAARGSRALASIATLGAAFVHPPLALWAPAVAALSIERSGRPSTRDAQMRGAVAVIAPAAIAALGVGLAAGGPVPTTHPGGAALGLFVATWLLLPLGWEQAPRAIAALRETPLSAGAAMIVCALIAAFAPSPFHAAPDALAQADRLAAFLFDDREGRVWLALSAALGAAIAGGLALSASQGPRRTLALSLSGAALATLVVGTTSAGVRVRDALVPTVVFLLLGPARSRRTERALLAAFVALDLYLLEGSWQGRWSPL